ncbi:hypothetical protein K492DRAFT_240757 [Lichtheimia hyalospora FSU 10163]|nr:hypothetical protein K492DRAFT_240757 [Lichtheimia hyalospora FSU 10163]
MGWGLFDHFSEQHAQVEEESGHEAKFSHELIAGAAAFEAAKAYNQHCEEKGEAPDHAMAKQIMAGAAGAFIDRLIETKGLDYIDHLKAKKHAEDTIFEGYDQQMA